MTRRFPALAVDLYEITMAAAYFENNVRSDAAFELFSRSLPRRRNFLLVAGLEQALEYLEHLRFRDEEIQFIRLLPGFERVSGEFFDYLAGFRFSGDVWAMPEGTVAFATEPMLRITAPMIEAQLVETSLLSILNFQTLVASKAARIVHAAGGRGVIEFGSRRAHGSEAAMMAARAAFIGGCVGTSNVEAAKLFGIPVSGTLAHSFVMAFKAEIDAFRAYMRSFPQSSVLLIDTYDTLQAAERATEFGPSLKGVRLDSGDVTALSRNVRATLDAAGMTETKIVLSGDLDEQSIARILDGGAKVDLFGVGTSLSTSNDAPALGGVYKLVEVQVDGVWQAKMKLSPEKSFLPFRKQVWRRTDAADRAIGDVLAIHDEEPPGGGQALLVQVMSQGERTVGAVDLHGLQRRAINNLRSIPPELFDLYNQVTYPVTPSERLQQETAVLKAKLGGAPQ